MASFDPSAFDSDAFDSNAFSLSAGVFENDAFDTNAFDINAFLLEVGGGVTVAATTDALVVSELRANISPVQATADALAIATFQATVDLDVREVSATTQALVLTESPATIALPSGDINVQASVDALVVAVNSASISYEVVGTNDALVLVEYPALIGIEIVATADALVIAEHKVDAEVHTRLDPLVIAENTQTILFAPTSSSIGVSTQPLVISTSKANIDYNVGPTTDALVVSGKQATIGLDSNVSATSFEINLVEERVSISLGKEVVTKHVGSLGDPEGHLALVPHRAIINIIEVSAATDAMIVAGYQATITAPEATKGGHVPPTYIKTKRRKKDESILEQVYELVAKLDEIPAPQNLKERVKRVEVKAEKVVKLTDFTQHDKQLKTLSAQIGRVETAINTHIRAFKQDEEDAIQALLSIL